MALSWRPESKNLPVAERFIDMFPKHYSLHGDHEKHFAVHDARDNTVFHISKKDIHPATQIKVMKLQKFADGGNVDEDSGWFNRMDDQNARGGKETEDLVAQSDTSERDAAKEARQMKEQEIFGTNPSPQPDMALSTEAPPPPPSMPTQSPGTPSPMMGVQQPPTVPEPPPRQPAAQPADQGPMSGFPTTGSLNQMQKQYEGAVNRGAQGQIEQQRQMAELYAPKLTAQEEAAGHFQKAMETYQKQADDLATQITNQKIDPNRFWNSKSEGSKFAAGLGILLSGFSPTGGALGVIQKGIDRDIDSQKSELGKKQTLLSDNFRKQGNLIAAESATRAQYESIFQGKLAMMAAKTNSPMIMATAQKEIMESRLRMQQYLQPVAQNQMVMGLRDSLNKASQQGKPIQQDPATYVPYLVPEARQAEVFKELGVAQNTRRMAGNIMQSFEDAAKENTVMRTGAGLLRTPGSVYALHQHMQPTFADLEGTVRQSAMDNTFTNVTPMPGDSEHKIKQKREALQQYLKSKSSATAAKGFGIDINNFESTAPMKSQDDQRRAWAQQNPNTPQAREIMQRLGR